jgi:hypothetical protein
LREIIVESIAKNGRFAVKDMHKYLLFETQEELINFFKANGLDVGIRMSKSAKEEIFELKGG